VIAAAAKKKERKNEPDEIGNQIDRDSINSGDENLNNKFKQICKIYYWVWRKIDL
jgi:hypothetical protein